MQNIRLNNILILTTEDNFYLGKLLLKLNKIKSYKFKYIIINEYSVKKNLIKKILVRILTIGFLNCILFIIRSLIKKTKKKDILSILDKKIIKLEKNNYSEKNIINNLNIKPDLIISLNFPFKISQDILRLSKFGGINLHLGLLPECKGLFPVTRSILNKIELGFTIHEMNNRIDEGRILKKEKINYKISNKIDYDKIYNILFKRSYYAILDTLRKINKNEKFIKITNTKNKNYFSHFTTKELLLLFLDKFKL